MVPDFLWNSVAWDMPVPDWVSESNLTPEQMMFALAVEMNGRRREAVAATKIILCRLRQARALTAAAGHTEATRLIDIAGMHARLVVHELDRR